MAIVGAFARIDTQLAQSCARALNAITGVSTFELEEAGKIGLIIEADSLNRAHDTITKAISSTPGVLGVWPVYVNIEDEIEHMQHEPSTSHEPVGADAS